MNDLSFIEQRLAELDNANPSLVINTPKKVTYPFIEIKSITTSEFDVLRDRLPDGSIPLMIRNNGKLFLLKNTKLCLKTVKILSTVSDKEILIKESKTDCKPIEDFISSMLMEVYCNE